VFFSFLSTVRSQAELNSQAQMALDFFLENPRPAFASFIPDILVSFPPDPFTKQALFTSFAKLIKGNQNLALHLIRACATICESSRLNTMLDIIVNSLSVIPFHLSSIFIDETPMGSFSASVDFIHSICTSENSSIISRYLYDHATSGSVERRTGFQHTISLLIKAKAPLVLDSFFHLFKVSPDNTAQTGSICEILLSMVSSGYKFEDWKAILDFLIDASEVANQYSIEFVFDAIKLFVHSLPIDSQSFFSFISSLISSSLSNGKALLAIIDSFLLGHKISELTPQLSIFLVVQAMNIELNPFPNLTSLIPELNTRKTVFFFVEKLDPAKHTNTLCSFISQTKILSNKFLLLSLFQ
jgi:hypothetical protein